MLSHIVHRVLQSFGVLAVMSLAVFAGVYAVGNPMDILVNPQSDQNEIARATAALGLDRPLHEQYFIFIKHAAAGDLGRSFAFNVPAIGLILERMPATLELATAAMLIAVLLGIPLGLWAGLKPRSAAGRAIMAGSILGFSLPTFWVGLVLLALVLLAALFAPWIAPQNPYDLARLELLDSRLPPGARSAAGAIHWLGTDDQGRDMLSAILYGLRTSVAVGFASTTLGLAIGVSLGLAAAWLGGWRDALVMRLADLQLSFPSILIALVLLAVLGQGLDKIIVALVAVQWAYYARTARAAALVERRKEYIDAAVALALSNARIIFRHLLPNCLPPLLVLATVQVAG